MFSPSLKLHYSVYVNLLSLYHWMQVTLISSHYLIKHDLTNTSLMNIHINKLIYHCWTYYLDINHQWTYITWTRTIAGCVMFQHKPLLDMYYLDINHCWTYHIILNMNYTTARYELLDSSHYWTYDN